MIINRDAVADPFDVIHAISLQNLSIDSRKK